MKVTSRSIKLGAAAAIGLMAIGSGVAYGYPDGTAMMETAVRVPTPRHHWIKVFASVTQADPRCDVVFSMRGVSQTVHVSPDGTASATLERASIDGGRRLVVTARTTNCTTHEHAKAKVDSQPAHLEGPATVKRYQSFTINAENWPPNVPVTCTATLAGYSRTMVRTATTDKYGNAYFYGFWLPRKGAWGIVCAGGDEMHTWWVQVK